MAAGTEAAITVSALEERDIPVADAVFRLAFGTTLGFPEPQRFAEGAELVRTRWLTDPESAFKAEADGELVGCAFVTRWGSYAVFGPLAVRPDYWDRGVGRLLWEARVPLLKPSGITHAALFTRVEPKNLHLYRKFGFWPGSLTVISAKEVDPGPRPSAAFRTFAELEADERALDGCRSVTDALQPGLDLEQEIRAVEEQRLGDTIFVDGDATAGFAICHAGEGSEAGPGACYVRFAVVASGEGAAGRLERLLDACETYTAGRGLSRLVVGVNMGREQASRTVLDRGFRTLALGVAMHRPNEPSWDRPDAYVLDDRR